MGILNVIAKSIGKLRTESEEPATLQPARNQIGRPINSFADFLNESVQQFSAGRGVVFCGAGISLRSGLPLAGEFVSYIVDRIGLTKEQATAVVNSGLPFEAFVETLRGMTDTNVLLGAFAAQEPNTNHRLIAKLAKAGKLSIICTTNFDRLIEIALESEDLKAGRDYKVFHTLEVLSRIDWADGKIRVIKLHGSVEDRENMAITLRQVARKDLTEQRRHVIEQVFSTGGHSVVLVLGYSCSDEFDISPQIRSLSPNRLKTVFFVQHQAIKPDAYRIEDIRLQKGKNPFEFGAGIRVFCDTDALVDQLWRGLIVEPPAVWSASLKRWPDILNQWLLSIEESVSPGLRLWIAGKLLWQTAQFEAALTYVKQAVDVLRKQGTQEQLCICLALLGTQYRIMGSLSAALDTHMECLAISRSASLKADEATALANIALVHFERQDIRRAITGFEEAIPLLEATKAFEVAADALGNLGVAYQELPDLDKALRCHRQALELARALGYKKSEGAELGNLGSLYTKLKDFKKAIAFHHDSLSIAKSIGDMEGEGRESGGLGVTFGQAGDMSKAIEWFNHGAAVAERIGDIDAHGTFLQNLGVAYDRIRENQKAVDSYKKAIAVFQSKYGEDDFRTLRVKQYLSRSLAGFA
jgi:tetratricopeptide (TPR) repeat protein/NAD-dependent SIR2 family protein deacetylase